MQTISTGFTFPCLYPHFLYFIALSQFLLTDESVRTDEIFIVSLKVTNMVFPKLMGIEIHDIIKTCLYYIENKTMAVRENVSSSFSGK